MVNSSKAAKCFLSKTPRLNKYWVPSKIDTDHNPASNQAINELKPENSNYFHIIHRKVKYLNKIEVRNGVFNKAISISGFNSIWHDSKINANIYNTYSESGATKLKDEPWIISIFRTAEKKTPEIILDNTIVTGYIEFTDAKGLVLLRNKAKVLEKIKNAQVKNQ